MAYVSRALNEADKNYGITEIECLALVNAIDKFRPYIYGKHLLPTLDHCYLAAIYFFIYLKNPNGR